MKIDIKNNQVKYFAGIASITVYLFILMSFINGKSTPIHSVPDGYKKIYGAVSITSDGEYIIIKSNGTPDHKSIYYNNSDSLYENFSGITFNNMKFRKNPNSIVTNAVLDEYHGHTTGTKNYPNGIYYYHITSTDPYINGSGFYGTPGTLSR